jgi:hypothetical protein
MTTATGCARSGIDSRGARGVPEGGAAAPLGLLMTRRPETYGDIAKDVL